MKFSLKYIILSSALIPWFSAFSYQATVTSHKICAFKDTNYRTIRVHQNNDNCDVFYTKLGKDSRIAVRRSSQSCTNVIDNVVGNLQRADWTCKDAYGSGFTIEST